MGFCCGGYFWFVVLVGLVVEFNLYVVEVDVGCDCYVVLLIEVDVCDVIVEFE